MPAVVDADAAIAIDDARNRVRTWVEDYLGDGDREETRRQAMPPCPFN